MAAQQVVSKLFREVTCVPEGTPWPKWTGDRSHMPNEEADATGECAGWAATQREGLPVNLEGDVTDSINRAVLTRVAEAAMSKLVVCEILLGV